MASKENLKSSINLVAQFQVALENDLDLSILKNILDRGDNINCQISESSYIAHQKSELIGSTLLHLAERKRNYLYFKYLMKCGIDFTITNNNGSTALLQPIEYLFHDNEGSGSLKLEDLVDKLSNPYTELVLSMHVSQKIVKNPCNKYGISHFHVASLLNKATVVEYFLKNGVSVNQAISSESPIFAGYTPLHLSIISNSLETMEILLKYGANIHCKDSRGLTPLHTLIAKRLDIFTKKQAAHTKNIHFHVKKRLEISKNNQLLEKELQMMPEKVCLLLQNHSTNIIDDTGLSRLHVACIFSSPQLAQLAEKIQNVNHAINVVSTFFPGYTSLHFAMLFKSDLVALLLKKGADIGAKDANGVTPHDICLESYSIEEMHSILSSIAGRNEILMSDGRTRLSDVISALRHIDTFNDMINQRQFDINTYVPNNSPLFPGFSTLHLAVTFVEKSRENDYFHCQVVNKCLALEANLFAPCSHGPTPLHLAFRLHKTGAVYKLLLYHNSILRNAIDAKDNLSILHIAAVANDVALVGKLLKHTTYDINSPVLSTFEWLNKSLPSGSTLLHIAVATDSAEMLSLLLERGADIYARDANGLTPIHLLLADGHEEISDLLLSLPNLQDRVVTGANLSHLHVACFANNVKAVERLLNSESDIEAAITYQSEEFSSLAYFEGFTPIHIAMKMKNLDVMRYLLHRGADIFAKKPDGSTPLYEYLIHIRELWVKDELLRSIEDDIGLTILHLGCHELDFELVQDSLKRRVNVNSRVHSNSPIWPGCTPLHVLMRHCMKTRHCEKLGNNSSLYCLIKLLLANGADVALLDTEGDSPLHIANDMLPNLDGKTLLDVKSSFMTTIITEMLSSIRDFTVNPKNKRGITHFHVACRMCHMDTLKMYLDVPGCDTNQQIDYFSCDKFAGYTPLHLSASCCLLGAPKLEAFDLLLSCGADIHAKDILENTPLHMVARLEPPLRENILRRIVKEEADLNLQNLLGETPFEIILKTPNVTIGEIKLFLDSGCHPNTFNPITKSGFLPFSFDKKCYIIQHEKRVLDILINYCDMCKIDHKGRTAIHNVVSIFKPKISDGDYYFTLIKKLIEMGCDLDHQDESGKTALHSAVKFHNHEAVRGLLNAGADVNILDANKKSAVSYCPLDIWSTDDERWRREPRIMIHHIFALHLHKLLLFNLDVIQQNMEFQKRAHSRVYNAELQCTQRLLPRQIEAVELVKVGSTLMPLRNFLSETAIVAAYPTMPLRQREDINQFFKAEITSYELGHMEGLLRLQYRKAVKRRGMMDSAKYAMQVLAEKSIKYSLKLLTEKGLPDPCSEAILRCLTTKDFDNLIASTEHLNE